MKPSPKLRNLAFVHPAFDRDEAPGFRVDEGGRLRLAEGRVATRQALLLLLTTRRGERVMRPEYGSDLERLVFLPNDDTTAGLAIHYVRRAIERWAKSVEIVELDAFPDLHEDAEVLEIRLRYRLRSTGEADELTHRLQMASEVTS